MKDQFLPCLLFFFVFTEKDLFASFIKKSPRYAETFSSINFITLFAITAWPPALG